MRVPDSFIEIPPTSNDGKIPVTKKRVKEVARELKEKFDIRSCEAHEMVAKYYGYNSYNHLLKEIGEIK